MSRSCQGTIRRFTLLVAVALLMAPALHIHAQHNDVELDEIRANQTDNPVPTHGSMPDVLTCTTGVPINLYFSDLEADNGGWTVTSGDSYWEWGAVTAGFDECDDTGNPGPAGSYSGSNAWATNLDGCYPNFGSDTILSQTFDLSSIPAGTEMELSWWHWYHVFETFDWAIASINGTEVWRSPGSDPSADWEEVAIDISTFAGSSITVEFLLHATTVVNRPGWYLDDITLAYCSSQAEADLQITKTASGGNVAPGASVTYAINVTNLTGGTDATGVVVSDTIPAGLTYQSNTCGGTFTDPTFTWNIGTVMGGANVSCDVVCTVDTDATGNLVNSVSVTATTGDPDISNNTDAAPLTVQQVGIPTLGGIGMMLLGALIAMGAVLVLRQRF